MIVNGGASIKNRLEYPRLFYGIMSLLLLWSGGVRVTGAIARSLPPSFEGGVGGGGKLFDSQIQKAFQASAPHAHCQFRREGRLVLSAVLYGQSVTKPLAWREGENQAHGH